MKGFFAKFLALVLVIFFLNIFQSPIKSFAYSALAPAASFFLNFGDTLSEPFYNFLNVGRIDEENNSLKREVQKLNAEIALLKDNLKQSADFSYAKIKSENDGFDLALVKIAGINPDSDTIIINKGKEHGIQNGMPLISKEKVLYGKVLQSFDNFSEVILISSRNSVFDVKVQPTEGEEKVVYGAIKGLGNFNVFLDLVSLDLELREGSVLITSGLEGFFPANLLVGEVASINKSDTKPFQTSEVKPFFELRSIENLFVITNYLDGN